MKKTVITLLVILTMLTVLTACANVPRRGTKTPAVTEHPSPHVTHAPGSPNTGQHHSPAVNTPHTDGTVMPEGTLPLPNDGDYLHDGRDGVMHPDGVSPRVTP